MKTPIERLTKLRNIAILTKDPMQFGLTSLLIDLKYGTEYELNQGKIEQETKELTL